MGKCKESRRFGGEGRRDEGERRGWAERSDYGGSGGMNGMDGEDVNCRGCGWNGGNGGGM